MKPIDLWPFVLGAGYIAPHLARPWCKSTRSKLWFLVIYCALLAVWAVFAWPSIGAPDEPARYKCPFDFSEEGEQAGKPHHNVFTREWHSDKGLWAVYKNGELQGYFAMGEPLPLTELTIEWLGWPITCRWSEDTISSIGRDGKIEHVYFTIQKEHRSIQIGLRSDGVVVWREILEKGGE